MKRPDVRRLHRRARRLARWTGSVGYRTIVVPLLDREETEHAVDLACRLAADRGARIVLVAPAVLDRELPINAHLDGQLSTLKERLESAAAVAVAVAYGVAVRREIVRTRPGSFGEEVARVAAERRAELVVVGAPVESRRGFHRAFPREVLMLVRDAPCRVLIATGPVAGSGGGATAARNTVPPWHDGVARPSNSSASSERTRSLPPPTATSALRSTTRSA
jgi:nucleotide-binding universal stress UspA family protein